MPTSRFHEYSYFFSLWLIIFARRTSIKIPHKIKINLTEKLKNVWIIIFIFVFYLRMLSQFKSLEESSIVFLGCRRKLNITTWINDKQKVATFNWTLKQLTISDTRSETSFFFMNGLPHISLIVYLWADKKIFPNLNFIATETGIKYFEQVKILCKSKY